MFVFRKGAQGDFRRYLKADTTPYETTGRFTLHGWACSKAADACSTFASEPRGPMMCRPIGMPSSEKPQGTLAAVWPLMLIG